MMAKRKGGKRCVSLKKVRTPGGLRCMCFTKKGGRFAKGKRCSKK